MIPDFPPSFDAIRKLYTNFRPEFEFHRQSFSEWWEHYLHQVSLDDFQKEINADTEVARRVKQQLLQRHFYRSATSFYRSFDLFLGFLALQRQRFGTWAEVTGYYSRFYFIQAFLNLLQANWFGAEDSIAKDGLINQRDCRFFAYNTGQHFVFLRQAKLLAALGTGSLGSHAIWWKIYDGLEHLEDFPQLETLDFVLGDGYFNVEQRNKVNYSHEYIEGFSELEWFDSDVKNMIAHFRFQPLRQDRDITDIDRFFEQTDPETAEQNFVHEEKLAALTDAHLGDVLPRLRDGIIIGIRESLA